jgi:hypothetical protein
MIELPVRADIAGLFFDHPARDIAKIVRHNARDHQRRIDWLRQLERLFKCEARAEAAVERYQNSFVHDDPLPGCSSCFSVRAQACRSLDPHQFTRPGVRRTNHVRSGTV